MAKLNQQGIAHLAIILGVVAVSVIGFAGWRVNEISQNNKVLLSSSENQVESKLEQLPLDINGIKTVEEISAITVQQNSDAQIAVIELEQEDSGLVYKVRLQDGRVLVYNATTGQLVTSQTEDPSDRNSIPSGFVASVSISRAKEIAQAIYPDKTVKKIEFELEDGVVVYSVRFTDGSRVDVNAANGEVTRKNAENDSQTQTDNDSKDNDDSQESQSSNSDSGSSEQEDSNDDTGTDDNSGSNSGSGSGNSDDSDNDDSNNESDMPDDSDNR